MAVVDDERVIGRGPLRFADERDIDAFVDMLGKYERGEIAPNDWRRFRLLRGTYGQRQDGVQMLRIKVPQGILSSSQLRAIASIASRYSRGFGHITTRQNIQLHFVPLKDAEAAMREIAAEGLTTREACGNSVRNITGCPYAGTSPTEVFDVSPYAEAMTRYFLRHPLSGILPRKFKIAFEGCTEDHIYTPINDIGFRARIVDGRKGWRVTVAGSTSIMAVSGYLLYDFVPVEEMFNIGEAVARVFRKYGDFEHPQRNRLKFAIKTLGGFEAFKVKFQEELDGFKADGGASLPFDPETVTAETAPDWTPAAAPTVTSVATMAASTPVTGPGIVPGSVKLTPLADAYVRWMKSNVSRQRQEGYCHVTARLPLGDFTSGQMRVLADLAEAYGDGTVRVTAEQNVLFRWVKPASVQPLYERLQAAGLGSPDALRLSDVVSCPGAESCRLAVTQSRGLGRMLTEHLSSRPDLVDLVPSGDIKISGCPNGCGQHHVGSIGFQGSVRKVAGRAVPQYFVLVGGGCTADSVAHFGKVVSKVPAHRLTDALDRLLELYRAERQGEENLGAFFRRIPAATATEALKDLAQLMPNDVTEQDFIDLGESQAFAPEVMDGECAS
ncbi:MAG TPA: nitrite/sulfite reductase [Vicinamibacterales bacterium]|nr:nitrite/sulfite reductase [Vicinamibacterales bacterium]